MQEREEFKDQVERLRQDVQSWKAVVEEKDDEMAEMRALAAMTPAAGPVSKTWWGGQVKEIYIVVNYFLMVLDHPLGLLFVELKVFLIGIDNGQVALVFQPKYVSNVHLLLEGAVAKW